MTMSSFRIYRYPPGPAPDLSQPALDLEVTSCGAPLRHSDYLGRLTVWADQRGLETHWIDNCWARVVASADDAVSFIRELLAPGASEADLRAALKDVRYVLEAEEY